MEPYTYKIVPLVLGKFPNYDRSLLLFNSCCGQKADAFVLAFLIQGASKNILVDTGCGMVPEVFRNHPCLDQGPGMDIATQLSAHGLHPQDIDCIIQTSLHWDCCGNSALFPCASIYVQKREVAWALSPFHCQYEEYETEHIGRHAPWRDYMDRLVPIDGDMEIYPGVTAIALPGHSEGFQGVLVTTEGGSTMIAGDCVPLYWNWTGIGGVGGPIPPAVHSDLSKWAESYATISQKSNCVIAGRDRLAAEGIALYLDGRGGYRYGNL